MIDNLDPNDLMVDSPTAGQAGPVVTPDQPEEEDTITLPSGIVAKKEHIGYLNGRPYIKPGFRSQYVSGLPAGYGSGVPGKSLAEDISFGANEVAKNLSVPGKALADFFVDASTTVANRFGLNAEGLNKQWDTLTREDTETRRQIRKMLSVILPGFGAGRLLGLGANAMKLQGGARLATVAGGSVVTEAAIMGLSDEGLEEPAISRRS